MPIHHATRKSALDRGVTLEEQGDFVLASRDGHSALAHDGKSAVALVLLNSTLAAEYPSIRVRFGEGAEAPAYIATANGDDIEPSFPQVPTLDEVLYLCQENDIDPEAEVDEDADEPEEGRVATVVPSKYKQMYAERGHPEHCGDWLALRLNEHCHTTQKGKKGTFNLDRFTSILEVNSVPLDGTWATSRSRGWQGRFRMTGRNMLAKVVADSGVLLIPDYIAIGGKTEYEVPESFAGIYATRSKMKAAKAAVLKPE